MYHFQTMIIIIITHKIMLIDQCRLNFRLLCFKQKIILINYLKYLFGFREKFKLKSRIRIGATQLDCLRPKKSKTKNKNTRR